MARKFTGVDIAILICGILLLCFTAALFGITSYILNLNETYQFEYVRNGATYIIYGISAWYAMTAILAIASGASRHRCPYITVIVISILGVFISVGAAVVLILVVYYGLWNEANEVSVITGFIENPSLNFIQERNLAIVTLRNLGIGVMGVNFLVFVMLIIISSLGCCGTCCVNRMSSQTQTQTHIIAAAPPAYVSQPPPGQQYQFQDLSNPKA